MLKIIVFIKQVPDTSSKAGVNPDGTIDRARAKRMLNTFDKYALQKALEVKNSVGAEIVCVTMGPPPAREILVEGLEYGADMGILLTDKRLAASDTLATAYALHMVAKYVGDFDLILTGLQTTDGDTAQTGPQIAERLNIPQITYCEQLSVNGNTVSAKRIIEAGHQEVELEMPALITMANSATPLEFKRFANVAAVKKLLRNKQESEKKIKAVNLDDIGADPKRAGLVGSPTVVGKTWKLGDIGGSCKVFQGEALDREIEELAENLAKDDRGIDKLVANG
ncbi:MAG: electron transfer flavoprotein subunit beta/FixA family protein [Nitrospinota bacterium]